MQIQKSYRNLPFPIHFENYFHRENFSLPTANNLSQILSMDAKQYWLFSETRILSFSVVSLHLDNIKSVRQKTIKYEFRNTGIFIDAKVFTLTDRR